jgi:uncharacterized membrane protein YkvA (DUF1232 family)
MGKQPLTVLTDIVVQIRLVWRLLRDRVVPLWTKAVPAVAVAYVLWPIDLLPDALLGLGQLDDLAIVVLGARLFVSLCPQQVVQRHLAAIRGEAGDPDGKVVDASFRVLDQ